MSESNIVTLSASRERPAATASGYLMLLMLLVVIVLEIAGIVSLANDRGGTLAIIAVILGPLAILFIAPGFYMLQPNQAVSITRHTICAAISIGLPRKSLTLMRSEMKLLARTETFFLPYHGSAQRSPVERSVPL